MLKMQKISANDNSLLPPVNLKLPMPPMKPPKDELLIDNQNNLFKNLVLINFKFMVYGYFYCKGLGLRVSVSVWVKGWSK